VSRPGHHESHRALITPATSGSKLPGSLDVIVVPTARQPGYLKHAAGLAMDLRCALIVLASRAAKRAEIVTALRPLRVDRLHFVDMPAELPLLPRFRTSSVLRKARMERVTDVSAKRNVGLAVARMAGLKSALFLDDDMRIRSIRQLRVAAGLSRTFDVVGMNLKGYPDNSVVCHANRDSGGHQDTFVGGGALVAATDRPVSLFPDIYNEDWFFLLAENRLRSVTTTGEAFQKEYDPYANVRRARLEEFGDVLAEGIFSLLDDGKPFIGAGTDFWISFINDRHRFIGRTIEAVEKTSLERLRRRKMIRSLEAAREQLVKKVNPKLCVDFVDAWAEDLSTWHTFMANLPTGLSIEKALATFGFADTGAVAWDTVVPVPVSKPSAGKELELVGAATRHVALRLLVSALEMLLTRRILAIAAALCQVACIQLLSRVRPGLADRLRSR
jgi:glycosyltransferase involved in cell wall biosynthesis